MLTPQEGKQLISLARKTIELEFSKKDIGLSDYSKFSEKQGVFVTLHKHGELRGCVGFPYPYYPLNRAIVEAARAAAFDDCRFEALSESELKEVDIELSVLTVPEEIKAKKPEDYLKKIDIGKDGLIVKNSWTAGLLLPQVFTEYKCTPQTALEMTCQKGGLDKDAWKEKETKVLKFQAQIFEEK